MATKNVFTLDSTGVTNVFDKIIGYVTKSKVTATTKEGKTLGTLPLIFVILGAIFLPVLFAIALIIGLAASYKFAIVKEVEDEIKLLDK